MEPILTDQSLASVYRHQYAPQNMKLRAKSTKLHYRIMLGHLAEYLGRDPVLSDLQDATAAGFAHWLLNGRRSVVTVNQRLNYLRALWNWCARQGLVGKFPTLGNFPEPKRVPRAWTEQQLTKLFNACCRVPGRIGGVRASDWWLGLHLVLWDTGERAAATLAMRWDWLDLETGTLDVPPEVRKGGTKGMIYTLKPATLAVLRRIKSPARDMVFPWGKCVSQFYLDYNRLLIAAELPADRRCKPQKMRRSFASHVEAAGGNATEALAHSSRKVTTNSYLDPSIVSQSPANLLLPIIQINQPQ